MTQTTSSEPLGQSISSPSFIEEEEKKQSKTLVICIDRDDDIGRAGVKTPVMGRSACVEAATKLALKDPEEADANAMFGAVQLYDDMVEKNERCEIVTVSGLFERGVRGDRKIRSQVADVLKG